MSAPLSQISPSPEQAEPEQPAPAATATPLAPREAPDSPRSEPEPGSAELAPYWVERKRYLKQLRKVPELRQRFRRSLLVYSLRRLLWSFCFFPVIIAFWVPLVMASFNPVILVTNLLPQLEAFIAANPEVQAHTTQTLVVAWLSVGFFFLIFDFILTPFRSPYDYEADVHMRVWEDRQSASRIGDGEPQPDNP
ncbi:hypothetical protein [Marinobacter bohaiensis]|uniref:hypothetical protein n=1 Tax=Marinobacter bohaiensis TaxID=2201898 RepID=UPI001D17B56B|nr:hypothetical protein [Marinobacter bohaiensis]